MEPGVARIATTSFFSPSPQLTLKTLKIIGYVYELAGNCVNN
jgi:hypothetical protein